MKTSFHFGNLNKQKYKSYYYHGLKLICKEPFHPPPYITFPIHTPENPANFFYECDGLPATATPPMTFVNQRACDVWSSNSLLHFRSKYSPYAVTTASWRWNLPNPVSIEFVVSFPNIYSTYHGNTNISGSVFFPYTNGISFETIKVLRWLHDDIYDESSSYFRIIFKGSVLFTGPFISTWAGKLVKNPLTSKWNIFYNNILIASDLVLNPSSTAFYFAGSIYQGNFIDLDYFRVWLNVPRVP